MERAEALDCVTQLDKVRIQFLLRGQRRRGRRRGLPRAAVRKPCCACSDEFYRLQTRRSRRGEHAGPPRVDGRPARGRAAHPRHQRRRRGDRGCRRWACASSPEPSSPTACCACPTPHRFSARLVVRNLFRITRRGGAEVLRAGYGFADLPRGAEDAIQRYILRAERTAAPPSGRLMNRGTRPPPRPCQTR